MRSAQRPHWRMLIVLRRTPQKQKVMTGVWVVPGAPRERERERERCSQELIADPSLAYQLTLHLMKWVCL